MKFCGLALLSFVISASLSVAQQDIATEKKGTTTKNNLRRKLKKQTRGCTVLATSDARVERRPNGRALQQLVGADEEFYCELDPADGPDGAAVGHTVPLVLSPSQKAQLRRDLHDGALESAADTYLDPDATIDGEGVHVPQGHAVRVTKGVHGRGGGGGDGDGDASSTRRRLANKKGDLYVLAVRVTDSNNLVHPHSAAAMSNNIFGNDADGTGADPVNMVSQFDACSYGQLRLHAGIADDPDATQAEKDGYAAAEVDGAPGMIEVTIDVPLEGNSRGTIRNAVTAEVQAKLGFNLPGPFDLVMYMLEKCYTDCGWAAYAYINSWNSVYQGNYYYQTGVQMHELGHNFNLAHSGGLDGQTYTDHTCLMGNPLYSDDIGKMCFNPAKNWELSHMTGDAWYHDRKELLDPVVTPTWTQTLVGVADYGGIYGTSTNSHPVMVKIETRTTSDYFVAFNRAAGINSQNDEADNEVTVVEMGNNGQGYSQSWLRATLVQGESHTITNFGGSGLDLVITAVSIDTTAQPATALVSANLGAAPTPPPVPTPQPTTPKPVTAAPSTAAPSAAPVTSAPSAAPVPTSGPTSAPTRAPVTDSPTPAPATAAPVPLPACSSYTGGGECKAQRPRCVWSKGSCVVGSAGSAAEAQQCKGQGESCDGSKECCGTCLGDGVCSA